jgi:hypothetical protein
MSFLCSGLDICGINGIIAFSGISCLLQNPEIDSKNYINDLYFFKGFPKGKLLFCLYL